MRIIALDTATTQATVCVAEGGEVLAEAGREVTTHSEGLLTLIQEVLAQTGTTVEDLRGIVCGTGPGSFTGLRIGMATAKGLAFARGVPMVGVCSLEALAVPWVNQDDVANVLTLIDGRRKEVFGALFTERHGLADQAASAWVCRPEDLVAHIEATQRRRPGKLVVVGDGALNYKEVLTEVLPDAQVVEPFAGLQARHLLGTGVEKLRSGDIADLAQLEPLYLRPVHIRPKQQRAPV